MGTFSEVQEKMGQTCVRRTFAGLLPDFRVELGECLTGVGANKNLAVPSAFLKVLELDEIVRVGPLFGSVLHFLMQRIGRGLPRNEP